jgi:hypothetical protein
LKNKHLSGKVLVMCLADPSGDPRPRRIIELCASQGLGISVLGYPTQKPLPSVTSYYEFPSPPVNIINKIWRSICSIMSAIMPSQSLGLYFEKLRFSFIYATKRYFRDEKFDLLFVENIQLLPLAFEIKGGGKIVLDAREYYPRENEGELWFDLFERRRRVKVCRDYLPRCDVVLAVSEGLRREFLKEFGVNTVVYRSTPPYVELPVCPTDSQVIRMVYHGVANRNRRIEKLIEIVSLLDERFFLDLILTGNPRYQQELQQKAASISRVSFPQPVPFDEIAQTIGQYDIGLLYFEPVTFNLKHSLPNKFFECILSRLMIVIGPSPDMAELVSYYGCGAVAEEFSVQSMVKVLSALSTEDIDNCKQQSDIAARELCFEKESAKMITILNSLLTL